MIAAITFYRYEPGWLVDEWLDNIHWVSDDGHGRVIAISTRGDPRPWIPKRERKERMAEHARSAGANWLLELDADERLEDSARTVLPALVDELSARTIKPGVLFRLREMWTPTAYRVDGRWGRKRRGRLRPLHDKGGPPVDSGLNIYHLGMIEPESRRARRDTHKRHNRWDNGGNFDYMLNDRGLRLDPIEDGRGFSPPYARPYIRESV